MQNKQCFVVSHSETPATRGLQHARNIWCIALVACLHLGVRGSNNTQITPQEVHRPQNTKIESQFKTKAIQPQHPKTHTMSYTRCFAHCCIGLYVVFAFLQVPKPQGLVWSERAHRAARGSGAAFQASLENLGPLQFRPARMRACVERACTQGGLEV